MRFDFKTPSPNICCHYAIVTVFQSHLVELYIFTCTGISFGLFAICASLILRWYHGNVEILNGEDEFDIADNGSLIIRSVNGGHGGTYVCEAENDLGRSNSTSEVIVYGKPQIYWDCVRTSLAYNDHCCQWWKCECMILATSLSMKHVMYIALTTNYSKSSYIIPLILSHKQGLHTVLTSPYFEGQWLKKLHQLLLYLRFVLVLVVLV